MFKNDPHIVITSYLGGSPEVRATRFAYHQNQLDILAEMYPGLRVAVLCSGYTKDEIGQHNAREARYRPKRVYKFTRHHEVMKWLYTQKDKAVLLLDDDVVPVDSHQQLSDWLHRPQTIPAPCMFFSCKGLKTDLYTDNRVKQLNVAPLGVTGWAILIRSDLKMYPSIKFIEDGDRILSPDDMSFRVQLAAKGILTLKHQTMFFRTLQSLSSYKNSLMCTDHETRKAEMATVKARLMEAFPWLFVHETKAIWSQRGRVTDRLISIGALERTPYGLVPVPAELKKDWKDREAHKMSRIPLLDIVEDKG